MTEIQTGLSRSLLYNALFHSFELQEKKRKERKERDRLWFTIFLYLNTAGCLMGHKKSIIQLIALGECPTKAIMLEEEGLFENAKLFQ